MHLWYYSDNPKLNKYYAQDFLVPCNNGVGKFNILKIFRYRTSIYLFETVIKTVHYKLHKLTILYNQISCNQIFSRVLPSTLYLSTTFESTP